jgi:hypothetical protein
MKSSFQRLLAPSLGIVLATVLASCVHQMDKPLRFVGTKP